MDLLPDTQNCGLRIRRECLERFPRFWFQRKQLVSDPVMHVGIGSPRWRGKLSRHSRRIRNLQFYASGKRQMDGLTQHIQWHCRILVTDKGTANSSPVFGRVRFEYIGLRPWTINLRQRVKLAKFKSGIYFVYIHAGQSVWTGMVDLMVNIGQDIRKVKRTTWQSNPECQYTPLKILHGKHLFFGTYGPRQNGRHFSDDISKCIFFNTNIWASIKMSLKFVPNRPNWNITALVQIKTGCRPCDKPLSGSMMVSLLTHICVSLGLNE